MDITFQETNPYYLNSRIQGETEYQESQNWCIFNEITGSTSDTPTPTSKTPASAPELSTPAEPDTPATTMITAAHTQAHVQSSPTNPETTLHETDTVSRQDNNSDVQLHIAVRRSSRSCGPYRIEVYIYYGNISHSFRAFVSKLDQVQIPNSIEEALMIPEWKQTTYKEIKALEKNNTWHISDLPKGNKAVGYRWIVAVKHRQDGSVERLKARLVAKGYTQAYGVDYGETFAPVAKLNTVRVLLSMAVNLTTSPVRCEECVSEW